LMYKLYYHITKNASFFLEKLLEKRRDKNKEDPKRYVEKKAIITEKRPDAPLVWIHAASIGEARSALILINKIRYEYPDIFFLVTTGTKTSAQIMTKDLPDNTVHQYYPFDHPIWTKTFIEHWNPDLILWMESELWPNMLAVIKSKNIPAFLINARMSPKSYRNWALLKPLTRDMLSTFKKILCQTKADAQYYQKLGASDVSVSGNIKYSAAPLAYDTDSLTKTKLALNGRKFWLFASTHDGEEEMACRIHQILKKTFPELLTIIVPRHPERRKEIEEKCKAYTLDVLLRGEDKKLPYDRTDIYIVDTLGELGLFYRLADIACIGRSFSNDGGGGHNPIEAAQLECAVLYGPNVQNLQEIFDEMEQNSAAWKVNSEILLANAVKELLKEPEKVENFKNTAYNFSKDKSGTALGVLDTLRPEIEGIYTKRPISKANRTIKL